MRTQYFSGSEKILFNFYDIEFETVKSKSLDLFVQNSISYLSSSLSLTSTPSPLFQIDDGADTSKTIFKRGET